MHSIRFPFVLVKRSLSLYLYTTTTCNSSLAAKLLAKQLRAALCSAFPSKPTTHSICPQTQPFPSTLPFAVPKTSEHTAARIRSGDSASARTALAQSALQHSLPHIYISLALLLLLPLPTSPSPKCHGSPNRKPQVAAASATALSHQVRPASRKIAVACGKRVRLWASVFPFVLRASCVYIFAFVVRVFVFRFARVH